MKLVASVFRYIAILLEMGGVIVMIKSTESVYVGSLIAGDVPFEIPKYQRPYAWEEEQINDFIGDINELYTERVRNTFSPNRRKHFFGGIISIYRETLRSNHYTIRTYELVDGQQRFATLTMAIALLMYGLIELSKRAEGAKDNEIAKAATFQADTLKERYLEYKEMVSNKIEEHIRLKLSSVDAAFFENLLKGHGAMFVSTGISDKASHKRLRKAWDMINNELILSFLDNDDLNLSEKLDYFRVLGSCILEDCYLIHISSDDTAEAYRLFAILNDRGKTLSEGDLLRVYTLEMLEEYPIQQAHVEKDWDEILGYSYKDVEKFLRSYYPSHKGERAPRVGFADKFREHFFDYKRPLTSDQAAGIVACVEHMKKDLSAFLNISVGKWPYDNSESSLSGQVHLTYLVKILKHTLSIPLLISAYQSLSESNFVDIVDLLSRFAFRYINIVGVHPTSLQNLYYKQAVIIRQKRSSFDMKNFRSELARLQKNNAPDKLFEEAMKQKLNYKVASFKNYIRYFLITVEEYFAWYKQSGSGKPMIVDTARVFDIGKCTIEHIYSQSSNSPDPSLEPMTHDIGNLSFWGPRENNKVGNQSFADKQTYYRRSSILLNQELANLPVWNLEELTKRKEELIKIALIIFSV